MTEPRQFLDVLQRSADFLYRQGVGEGAAAVDEAIRRLQVPAESCGCEPCMTKRTVGEDIGPCVVRRGAPVEVPEAIAKALRYEAKVIEAQSQDVKALGKGRRHHLALCAERLRMLADGNTYPYASVSYGDGIRAFVDEL